MAASSEIARRRRSQAGAGAPAPASGASNGHGRAFFPPRATTTARIQSAMREQLKMMVKSLDVEIYRGGLELVESPISSRGMVNASAMMPTQSKAGTAIARWIPNRFTRKPTTAGPIKNAA